MTDFPSRIVGGAGVALQGLEAMRNKPQTLGDTASLLRNMMAGLAGTFGGRAGAFLASRNDLVNFMAAGAKKDTGGMVSSGASYLTSMLSMFRATTPLGLMIGAQQTSFNLAMWTEKNNPGAWDLFTRDPTFHHLKTGQDQFR